MKSTVPIMVICVLALWTIIIMVLVIVVFGDYPNGAEHTATAMLNYSPMIRSS